MNHLMDIILEYIAQTVIRLFLVLGGLGLVVGISIGYFISK